MNEEYQKRLDKAVLEVNTAENALGRALYALEQLRIAVAECTCTPTDHDHDHEPEPTPEEPVPVEPQPEEPHDHMPEPTPSDWVLADSITPIASNFVVNDWLAPPNGAIGTIAPSAYPDNVGAFRLTANMSHLSYDDPIVYPGKPGAAHLHHFFGNTTTNAFSTYESLRAAGHSTTDSDMVNRSAYWQPAMLDGNGNVVVPNHIVMYYKSPPASKPVVPGTIGVGIPAGLKLVFGNNYLADPYPNDPRQNPNILPKYVSFDLLRGNSYVLTGERDLVNILPLAQVGDMIYTNVSAPTWWDGKHVDSPNHRAHMAYGFYDKWTGQQVAPEGFTHYIPRLTLRAAFQVMIGDIPATWAFSSDIAANAPAGSTFHADYMEAWDPDVRQMWQDHAIDKLLNCSGGNLGNGRYCKRWSGFTFQQTPHLVPAPIKPS